MGLHDWIRRSAARATAARASCVLGSSANILVSLQFICPDLTCAQHPAPHLCTASSSRSNLTSMRAAASSSLSKRPSQRCQSGPALPAPVAALCTTVAAHCKAPLGAMCCKQQAGRCGHPYNFVELAAKVAAILHPLASKNSRQACHARWWTLSGMQTWSLSRNFGRL